MPPKPPPLQVCGIELFVCCTWFHCCFFFVIDLDCREPACAGSRAKIKIFLEWVSEGQSI